MNFHLHLDTLCQHLFEWVVVRILCSYYKLFGKGIFLLQMCVCQVIMDDFHSCLFNFHPKNPINKLLTIAQIKLNCKGHG
jgi:hypothetical protein